MNNNHCLVYDVFSFHWLLIYYIVAIESEILKNSQWDIFHTFTSKDIDHVTFSNLITFERKISQFFAWDYIINRTLQGSLNIWLLSSRIMTIFYSLAALVRKILLSPLEDKSHTFAPPCNILYIFAKQPWLTLFYLTSSEPFLNEFDKGIPCLHATHPKWWLHGCNHFLLFLSYYYLLLNKILTTIKRRTGWKLSVPWIVPCKVIRALLGFRKIGTG